MLIAARWALLLTSLIGAGACVTTSEVRTVERPTGRLIEEPYEDLDGEPSISAIARRGGVEVSVRKNKVCGIKRFRLWDRYEVESREPRSGVYGWYALSGVSLLIGITGLIVHPETATDRDLQDAAPAFVVAGGLLAVPPILTSLVAAIDVERKLGEKRVEYDARTLPCAPESSAPWSDAHVSLERPGATRVARTNSDGLAHFDLDEPSIAELRRGGTLTVRVGSTSAAVIASSELLEPAFAHEPAGGRAIDRRALAAGRSLGTVEDSTGAKWEVIVAADFAADCEPRVVRGLVPKRGAGDSWAYFHSSRFTKPIDLGGQVFELKKLGALTEGRTQIFHDRTGAPIDHLLSVICKDDRVFAALLDEDLDPFLSVISPADGAAKSPPADERRGHMENMRAEIRAAEREIFDFFVDADSTAARTCLSEKLAEVRSHRRDSEQSVRSILLGSADTSDHLTTISDAYRKTLVLRSQAEDCVNAVSVVDSRTRAPIDQPSSGAPVPREKESEMWPLWVSLGVAAAGAGVGTAFSLVATSKDTDSDQYCNSASVCNPLGRELRNDALFNADVATVGAVTAGAGLASAAIFWIWHAATSETDQSPVRVGPRGISLGATW